MTSTKNNLSVGDRATRQALKIRGDVASLVLLVPLFLMLVHTGSTHEQLAGQLLVTFGVSVFGYFCTIRVIPITASSLLPKLWGIDINKRGLGMKDDGEKVPESLGLVSGMLFLMCLIVLQMCYASTVERLLDFHAAMLAICFAILLGFADDIIDIRWRNKLPIAFLASLPLVVSYRGPTSIVIPQFLRFLLAEGQDLTAFGELVNVFVTVDKAAQGAIVECGVFYLVYMSILVVFCTNAINIYAGVNGLEGGQSLVIACSIAFMNIYELATRGDDPTQGNHLFSLTLMLPFIATTLGLLEYNWYPARVFVGDIFPYYAGMTFAVAAILGHFSKSLWLLLIPQLLNFLYSFPQLLRIVPNPRHRLPSANKKTGLLEPSKVAPNDNRNNLTLLSLALSVFGPMHERTLCFVLMGFQVLCAVLGLYIRYHISAEDAE